MKKTWLVLVLLPILAFVGGGCASSRPPAEPGFQGDPSVRPPETGTNIPRRIREGAAEQPTKRQAEKKAKPRPERPAQREEDEEIVTRGGFR